MGVSAGDCCILDLCVVGCGPDSRPRVERSGEIQVFCGKEVKAQKVGRAEKIGMLWWCRGMWKFG